MSPPSSWNFSCGAARSRGLSAPFAQAYDIAGPGWAVATVCTLMSRALSPVAVTAQVRVVSRAQRAELRVYLGDAPEDWANAGQKLADFTFGSVDQLSAKTSEQLSLTYDAPVTDEILFAIVVYGSNLIEPIGGPPLSTTGGTYAQNKIGAAITANQNGQAYFTGSTDLVTQARDYVSYDTTDQGRTVETQYPTGNDGGTYVVGAWAWLDNVQEGDALVFRLGGGVMSDLRVANAEVRYEMRAYRPEAAAGARSGAWESLGGIPIGTYFARPDVGQEDYDRGWWWAQNFGGSLEADVAGRWLLACLVYGSNVTRPVTSADGGRSDIALDAIAQWLAYDAITRNTPGPLPVTDDTTTEPPVEDPPEDEGEVFEEGEDFSTSMPCPPHYRRRTATHAPSVVPRLGKATEYRVQVLRRGGAIQELDIPPQAIASVSWERRVNDVAEHTVSVSKRWPDALRAIELTECWTHELAIWRVPERGQPEIVAIGPFVDYTESRTELTLVANDMGAWFGKRVIHADFDFTGCTDLAEIARVLINDGIGPDDPGLLPYARFIPTGITAQRSGAAFRLNLDKELGDMAEQGLDWTFVGRRLYVSGDLAAQWPHVARLGEQHFDQDVEVNGAGKEALTRKFVTNAESQNVYIGVAGGIDPVLGLLENTDNSDDVTDNQTARTAAKVALAAGYPVPYYVRVPDGASLTADAPVTIGQLIPGVGVSVEITSYLKPRIGLQRLTQVRTTWNAEEGEQIAVSLSPWAGVVEADDLARVATTDELGTTDYDVERDPDPVQVDDTDTIEGTASTDPTEPVRGDKVVGQVSRTDNLGHFGSNQDLVYPDDKVFTEQYQVGNVFPDYYGFPYLLAKRTIYARAGDRLYVTGQITQLFKTAPGDMSLQVRIAAGTDITATSGNLEATGGTITVDHVDPDEAGFEYLFLSDTSRWPNHEFDGGLFGYQGWFPFDVPATGVYTVGLVLTGTGGGGWKYAPDLKRNDPNGGAQAGLHTAVRGPRVENKITPGKAVTLAMTVEVPGQTFYTFEGSQYINAISEPGGQVSCWVFWLEGSTAPSSADLTNPASDMNRWNYLAGGNSGYLDAPGPGVSDFSWGLSYFPNYYQGTKTYTFFIACYGSKEWDEGSSAQHPRYMKLTGKNMVITDGQSGEAGTDGSTSDPTIYPIGPTDTADTTVNATATTDDGTAGAASTSDDDDNMSTSPRADPQTDTITGPENPTDASV